MSIAVTVLAVAVVLCLVLIAMLWWRVDHLSRKLDRARRSWLLAHGVPPWPGS